MRICVTYKLQGELTDDFLYLRIILRNLLRIKKLTTKLRIVKLFHHLAGPDVDNFLSF